MITVAPCGSSALQVMVHRDTYEQTWETTHRLARFLREQRSTGVASVVPTYDAVLVEFDVTVTDAAALMRDIDRFPSSTRSALAPADPRVLLVPLVVGGPHGPDFESVIERLGLTAREASHQLARCEVTIRCYSSTGSPMTDSPFAGQLARLGDPRVSVPQGSVAVAGKQAMIFTVEAPTGWNVIGRSPITLLDADADPIAAYQPGDRIRFLPLSEHEVGEYDGVR
ncbi:5-oxoprolinase subunit B family protein, partial [Mycolicibacterium sp.]